MKKYLITYIIALFVPYGVHADTTHKEAVRKGEDAFYNQSGAKSQVDTVSKESEQFINNSGYGLLLGGSVFAYKTYKSHEIGVKINKTTKLKVSENQCKIEFRL